MKHLTVFFVLLLFLLGMNVAVGADFQKGADAYNKGDYATALKEWRPLAEQGHAGAENNLGWMYDKGQGVPQDHKEAAKWTRLADGGQIAACSDRTGEYLKLVTTTRRFPARPKADNDATCSTSQRSNR